MSNYTDKVESLYDGDKRVDTLLNAIDQLIHDRSEDMPVVAIVGMLELLKLRYMDELLS